VQHNEEKGTLDTYRTLKSNGNGKEGEITKERKCAVGQELEIRPGGRERRVDQEKRKNLKARTGGGKPGLRLRTFRALHALKVETARSQKSTKSEKGTK